MDSRKIIKGRNRGKGRKEGTEEKGENMRVRKIRLIELKATGEKNKEEKEERRQLKSDTEAVSHYSTLLNCFSAWFWDNMGESLVDRISRRISETTGLETKHPSAEGMQVENARYLLCSCK